MIRSRRILTSITIAAVVALSASAAQGRPPAAPREVTEEYISPAPAVMPVHPFGAAVCNRNGVVAGNRGCIVLPVAPKERFVDVQISDASGTTAPGFVAQSDNPDTWTPICGGTDRPLKINPGVEVTIWVYAYRAPNLPPCAGAGTSGTVTVRFLTKR